MTAAPTAPAVALPGVGAPDPRHDALHASMGRHLWPHFTKATGFDQLPVFVSGSGCELVDSTGKRWLDGLAGLFTVQIGHGRGDLLRDAAARTADLAYFPLWGAATPPVIELAERLAALAPGDLNRVFFGTGGGESVETAWKMARQYHQLTGHPEKVKILSREGAYHGTTMGALSVTGMPGIRGPFEPLFPTAVKVPNTAFYRAPEHGDDLLAFGAWAADQVEATILAEGPETVAALIVEPVQNAGGSIVPPPGYLARLREICDTYDVLLIADETICGFGRLGTLFGSERVGLVPDILTCAKGLTSSYAILSAAIASDRVFAPFAAAGAEFTHGSTWGGHPFSAAVASGNLDVFDELGLVEHVAATESELGGLLAGLRDLEWVGDVRGIGHFWTVELVADRATKVPLPQDPATTPAAAVIAATLRERGLNLRAFSGGSGLLQLCPPLISGTEQFTEIADTLRTAILAGQAAL